MVIKMLFVICGVIMFAVLGRILLKCTQLQNTEYCILFSCILGLLPHLIAFYKCRNAASNPAKLVLNRPILVCSSVQLLGPRTSLKVHYIIICFRGTKTITVCLCKRYDQRRIDQFSLFSFFIYSAVPIVGK